MPDDTGYKGLFTSHGLKNTKHRNLVYNLLEQADCPLTAEGVYLRLKQVDASTSFSTVYRTLDTFVEKGLAEKSAGSGDGKAVFELHREDHRHRLVCIGCRKTVPIESCPLERYEKSLEKETHFDITAHRLELFGYCPDCKTDRLSH